MHRHTPAAAYLRVSSPGQQDGDGFPRQSEAAQFYADSHNLTLLACFPEPVSGTKDSIDRPGFSSLLAYCHENGVRIILIEKMDRWARDLIIGEILLAECRKLSIDVIDCATGQNLTEVSDDPYVKFVRQVMLAAAELNKNIVVTQTAKARRRIRERQGKCEGRKGYRDTPGWEHVVSKVEQLRHQGLSTEGIADRLNADATPTINGGRWRRSTVRGILGR